MSPRSRWRRRVRAGARAPGRAGLHARDRPHKRARYALLRQLPHPMFLPFTYSLSWRFLASARLCGKERHNHKDAKALSITQMPWSDSYGRAGKDPGPQGIDTRDGFRRRHDHQREPRLDPAVKNYWRRKPDVIALQMQLSRVNVGRRLEARKHRPEERGLVSHAVGCVL